MAASLVAYDSSDESSSGEDDSKLNGKSHETETDLRHLSEQGGTEKVDFFGTDAVDDDSDDEARCQTAKPATEKPEPAVRLPNPLSGLPAEEDEDCRSSVFTNYFHRAEERKLAVLEHHVKLSIAEPELKPGDAKKRNKKQQRGVCHNFQKGNCRYGDKCRFAHSTPDSETTSDTSSELPQAGLPSSTFKGRSTMAFGAFSTPLNLADNEDEDSFDAQKKRKLRAGITDSLVPPKRALQSLDKLRKQERPWTSETGHRSKNFKKS